MDPLHMIPSTPHQQAFQFAQQQQMLLHAEQVRKMAQPLVETPPSTNDAPESGRERRQGADSRRNPSGHGIRRGADRQLSRPAETSLNVAPDDSVGRESGAAWVDETPRQEVQTRLARRDHWVRLHEAIHVSMVGAEAGQIEYRYVVGPDGIAYAVEGLIAATPADAECPSRAPSI